MLRHGKQIGLEMRAQRKPGEWFPDFLTLKYINLWTGEENQDVKSEPWRWRATVTLCLLQYINSIHFFKVCVFVHKLRKWLWGWWWYFCRITHFHMTFWVNGLSSWSQHPRPADCAQRETGSWIDSRSGSVAAGCHHTSSRSSLLFSDNPQQRAIDSSRRPHPRFHT